MSPNKQNILDIAEAFRLAASAKREEDLPGLVSRFPAGSEAAAYLERIQLLREDPRRATDLRGFEFRPSFVRNSLIMATGQAFGVRAYICGVVATGLTEFADYFDFGSDGNPGPSPEEAAARQERVQRRFFAYCLAQLSEIGMELDDMFRTMKADALDQGAAYIVRAWIEDGPDALLASPLFITPEEKVLWKAVFDGKPGAWRDLQKHLIDTYQLPFLPAPQTN